MMVLAATLPLFTFAIYLVAILIVGAALWYAVSMLAPSPIQNFLKVIIVLLAAILLAGLLLNWAGGPALR